MAFKMRGKPVISGTNDHRSALQYKQKADAEYESALKKLSAKQKQMDVNSNGKIDAEDLAALRQSPNNANMSPADANYGSPADANMKSPADANMKDSPADANMGDTPAKYLPILANVVRAGATRLLPAVANVARTQAPKLLRSVSGGLGSFKDKAFNLVKKAAPSLISYGLGSYAGGEREKTKQKAKENVKKNQPKNNVKIKPPEKTKVPKRTDNPYSRAKKNDPNLDSYIRGRDKHQKGSAEYNAFQNKINAAYGVSKRHSVGGTSNTTKTVTSAKPSKADIKKTKIQTKADKRKGEVDENTARRTTRKTYRTAKKTGTAQEAADAKVKMLEAKLADVTGAGGGRKRVLFGKLTAKNIQKKLDKAKAKAGSPANFGPGKKKKSNKKMTAAEKAKAVIAAGKRFNKGETVEQVKGGIPFDASVRGVGTNKSKAKMKSASVGDKLRNRASKAKTKKAISKAGTRNLKDSASSED